MRETIQTEKDLINIYREGKHPYFKCMDYETVDTDLEKGIEFIEMVVQRNSDKKFFKFKFMESPHNDFLNNYFPLDGVEVFPEIITKIIYK